MNHPTKKDLRGMAVRSVGDAERETIESHLDECDECRTWYIDHCRQLRAGRADDAADLQDSVRRIEERIHREVEEGQVDEQTMLGSPLTLVRKLESGGLGDVFLYRDGSLDRNVALKVMKATVAGRSSARTRFLREYRITSRLDHPGVAPIIGKGVTQDGRDYYAMRFVDGKTLATAVDEFHARKLPVRRTNRAFRELLESFRTVCATIHHAHSQQVLHRDVKPENIMMEEDRTTVIDWGLARQMGDSSDDLDQESQNQKCDDRVAGTAPEKRRAVTETDENEDALTVAGQRLGTPGYMAPEQVNGTSEAIDERTDIYLLGGVLHYILIGAPPHSSMKRSQPGDIDLPLLPIDKPDRPVPRELVSIVRRALMRVPEDRYASAAALESDVENWLIHGRVIAHRYSAIEGLGRLIRRHTGSAVALATAGILLLVVSLTALTQVTEARDVAKAAQKDAEEFSSQASSSHELATEAWEELATEVYETFRYTPRTSQTRLRLYKVVEDGTRRLAKNAQEATQGNLTTVVALRRIAELSLNRFLALEQAHQTVMQAELLIKDLADDNSDDQNFLRERVYIRRLTSEIKRRAGESDEAERLLLSCVKELRQLNTRFPENEKLRRDLSQCLLLAGDSASAAGQTDEASRHYEEALKIAEALHRSDVDHSVYRRDYSVCLDRKAALLDESGIEKEALALHSQSLKMAEVALKEKRTLLTLSDVVQGHQNVARLQRRLKHLDLAESSCRQAIEIGTEMLTLEPDGPKLIRDQATSYSNLGDVLRDLNRTEEATAAYIKDLELTERLAKLAPTDVDLQLDLAISLRKLANFSAAQDEFAKATGFASRAVALTLQLQKLHAIDESIASSADRSADLLSRLLKAVAASQDRKSSQGPLAAWNSLAPVIAACQAAGDPREFGQSVTAPLSELLYKQSFAGMQIVFADSTELTPDDLRNAAQFALDLLQKLPADASDTDVRIRDQRVALLKKVLDQLNPESR